MASTNKVQAYIVAPVEAMDVPLPFEGYLKPESEWADPDTPEYYTLNEIDGTDKLGHFVKIRKSTDGKWFIYADSNFSYRLGHFKALEDMAASYDMPLYVLTTEKEVRDELNGTAGDLQITQWSDPNAPAE